MKSRSESRNTGKVAAPVVADAIDVVDEKPLRKNGGEKSLRKNADEKPLRKNGKHQSDLHEFLFALQAMP